MKTSQKGSDLKADGDGCLGHRSHHCLGDRRDDHRAAQKDRRKTSCRICTRSSHPFFSTKLGQRQARQHCRSCLSNAGITLLRAGIGFVIGAAIGFVLALMMNLFRPAEKVVFPYLMIIQMIPILGMAPIILAITKDINKSRIIIAAILTFYPVATNTLAGFKSVEREKHELMYSLAASKFEIYRKLLIPSCIPYLFTGLKISAPMAITASILVDTLQGGSGLGTHAVTVSEARDDHLCFLADRLLERHRRYFELLPDVRD